MLIIIFEITETCFNFRTCIDDGLGRIAEIILDKSTHNYGLLSYVNNSGQLGEVPQVPAYSNFKPNSS